MLVPESWYRPHPALATAGVPETGVRVSATTKRRLPLESKQIWPWGDVPTGPVPAATTRCRVNGSVGRYASMLPSVAVNTIDSGAGSVVVVVPPSSTVEVVVDDEDEVGF